MLKALQINLRHSKLATDNLLVILRQEDIDICLIQEPWIWQRKIMGLKDRSYDLFYSQTDGKPRACILVRKTINAFLLSNFSSPDVTVVRVEPSRGSCFCLVSAYMAHDKSAPPEEVQHLVDTLTLKKENILIGCDANARHTIWGSSEINERGESLFDFIISRNLLILNKGNTPTFVFPASETSSGWEEVLDITLSTNTSALRVDNWKVSQKNSFSDHRLIHFEIDFAKETVSPRRNPKRTDWTLFHRVFNRKLNRSNFTISTSEQLDMQVTHLERSYQTAFKVACPISFSKKDFPPWWSKTLTDLKEKVRKVFNDCYKTKNFQAYRVILREYKKAIRDAKRNSWKEYCGSIESVNDSARLSKILSKDHSCKTLVKRENGEWAESAEESLKILVDAHFPENSIAPGCNDGTSRQEGLPEVSLTHILSASRINWAIEKFSPFKSPGLDGIMPVMLQKTKTLVVPVLHKIFLACITLNHVPSSWKKTKVVFIPKAGRRGHVLAKDFRPISLTSFILKVFERVIDYHIREHSETKLSPTQHAYLKGKSTETALHEVVGTVEKSLEGKQFTLAAFIDIEGAFNNVRAESIVTALNRLEVERPICLWISSLLGCREIIAAAGGARITRFVHRGTPQGGVLSPLLWLVAIDEALTSLNKGGVKVVAYADDVVLLVSGPFPSVMAEILEGALAVLSKWAASCGLRVNSDKTELMLFTRKYKPPPFKLPRLNNQRLSLSSEVKYLGVILDPKLHWKLNIENRVRKASIAFYSCKSMFGKKWGLKPRVVLWMYNLVVLPILTYGCLVWWIALRKGYNTIKLERVQRSACIGISGACRTCPTAALNVILHLLPVDLQVQFIAAQSAIRLRELGLWRRSPVGHGSILSQISPSFSAMRTDLSTRKLGFEGCARAIFPSRLDWRRGRICTDTCVSVFTDGSKMESGVGAGVFSKPANISVSFKLPETSSVFQAEVFAILQACKMLRDRCWQGDVNIYSDSQAAIKALSSPCCSSLLVNSCKEEIKRFERAGNISLIWVPGHRNIEGNEIADELARKGSTEPVSVVPISDIGVPLTVVKGKLHKFFLKKAQDRWSSISSCAISKTLWPQYDRSRTLRVLGIPRHSISKLIAVFTGHWVIGTHAQRLGLPYNPHCRSCGDPAEKETVEHFLCKCPGLAARRLRFLRVPIGDGLRQFSSLDPSSLLHYINSTGWL